MKTDFNLILECSKAPKTAILRNKKFQDFLGGVHLKFVSIRSVLKFHSRFDRKVKRSKNVTNE